MANVKNFGLIGVGTNVQYGKGGSRLIDNAGTFNFKNAANSGDVAITTAGITSSAGNVTLTTGNVVMSDSAGTLSIGGDTTLSRHAAGIFQLDGDQAVVMPSGATGVRPVATATAGGMRYNTNGTMEYSNGTTWVTMATGGTAVTAVSVVSANGLAGTSSGGTTPALTLSTTVTGILKGDGTAISAAVSGTDLKTVGGNSIIGSGDVGTIGPTYGGTGLAAFASGTVLYASAANTWAAAVPGATSGVQPYDTDLTALANTSTTGIYVVTGSGTSTTTSLVAPAAGITISNPDGVAAAPTFALANDLAAVEGLATTGYAVRMTGGASPTWTTRSITGTTGRVVVTNGDGVGSDTNVDLDTVGSAAVSGFWKFSTDAYGRVPTTTAVTTGDITALVDATYVNVSGDTMSLNANLTFNGGEVLGLPATPSGDTAATSKAYVDSVAAGLNIHEAVEAKTATLAVDTQFNAAVYANGTLGVGATLTGAGFTVLGTVGGYASLVVGSRVLVDCYTVTPASGGATYTANGIYVVSVLGDGSTVPFQLTRASDFNNSIPNQVTAGDFVYVSEGSFAATGWVQSQVGSGPPPADAIIIGTDPIIFTQFSGAGSYTAGTGLTLNAGQFSVNLGAGIGEFNTNNVGIDLYSASTGGLILSTDGTTRSTSNAGKLQLLLPAGSGLTQDSTGLYIPNTGVTNAMLANSSFTVNGDSGTFAQSLGGTLIISGNGSQGVSSTATAGTVDFTVADASDSQKGVATFQATEFVVTAGNVTIGTIGNGNLANSSITFAGDTGSSAVALGATFTITGDGSLITTTGGASAVDITLGTVDVAHGGTGLTTVNQYQLLFGGPTNTVVQDADLAFNASSNTLTVGGVTVAAPTAALSDVTITATVTDADINLIPNGTGAVVIGPAGAGLIQSDPSQPLTVRGNTVLTLESGTGDIVMQLSGTTNAVTVSGPTAAQYAANVSAADLVNKYYVDTVAGSTNGDIKAVSATVDTGDATTAIGAALPAGATILSVKANVTVIDSGVTLTVGRTGSTSAYMASSENDPAVTGLYLAETMVTEGSSQQVNAYCSGGGGGTVKIVVTYQLAE